MAVRAEWAHDERRGARARGAVIDAIHARLRDDPACTSTTTAHAEVSALKRLMRAARDCARTSVDDLLRREVFVDLHTVVRQALRIGVESYSLKQVERLPGSSARAEVGSRRRRRARVRALARLGRRSGTSRRSRATTTRTAARPLALRDWLREQAPGDAAVARRRRTDGRAEETAAGEPSARELLRERADRGRAGGQRRAGWPASCSSTTAARRSPRGGLVRRACEMTPERAASPTARRSAGSSPWTDLEPVPSSSRSCTRCTFPPQEHKARRRRRARRSRATASGGHVVAIDETTRHRLRSSAGRVSSDVPLPRALDRRAARPQRPQQQDALAARRRVGARRHRRATRRCEASACAATCPLRRARAGRVDPDDGHATSCGRSPAASTELRSSSRGRPAPARPTPVRASSSTWSRAGKRVGVTALEPQGDRQPLGEIEAAAARRRSTFAGDEGQRQPEPYHDGALITSDRRRPTSSTRDSAARRRHRLAVRARGAGRRRSTTS